mmetsp:Transcript_1281/g.5688  ORF Transcript_1281/g.5688 Transcript_1281/m.5688 type:complete len:263 (+) Transcript_1281:239-1027(+)
MVPIEQRRAVLSQRLRQDLASARMEVEVRREVVDLPPEHRPPVRLGAVRRHLLHRYVLPPLTPVQPVHVGRPLRQPHPVHLAVPGRELDLLPAARPIFRLRARGGGRPVAAVEPPDPRTARRGGHRRVGEQPAGPLAFPRHGKVPGARVCGRKGPRTSELHFLATHSCAGSATSPRRSLYIRATSHEPRSPTLPSPPGSGSCHSRSRAHVDHPAPHTTRVSRSEPPADPPRSISAPKIEPWRRKGQSCGSEKACASTTTRRW